MSTLMLSIRRSRLIIFSAVQQIAPENIDKEVSAHPVVFLMLHPAQETASVVCYLYAAS